MALQPAGPARGDSLRAIIDTVFAGREYRWETREDPFGVVRRLWGSLLSFFERLRDQNPDAYRLTIWLLVGVLLLILGHAAWVAVRTMRGGGQRPLGEVAGPTSAPRDAAWYAAEAARLAQGGDYVAAMQADFLRLVLQLDARRVMAFHPSKTPSEYVREPALGVDARRDLRALVNEMYAYAFARVPLDRERYERWRDAAHADRYAPAR
jgi:hypothetical protein